jgi:hypothetical protein
MPKLSVSVPRYRKHPASGQTVVTIGGNGFYLGPHGTKISKAEYDRLVFEWLAAGRIVPEQGPEQDGVDEQTLGGGVHRAEVRIVGKRDHVPAPSGSWIRYGVSAINSSVSGQQKPLVKTSGRGANVTRLRPLDASGGVR